MIVAALNVDITKFHTSLAGDAGGRHWRASQVKPHKNRGDFN